MKKHTRTRTSPRCKSVSSFKCSRRNKFCRYVARNVKWHKRLKRPDRLKWSKQVNRSVGDHNCYSGPYQSVSALCSPPVDLRSTNTAPLPPASGLAWQNASTSFRCESHPPILALITGSWFLELSPLPCITRTQRKPRLWLESRNACSSRSAWSRV
jgi:hypothetical protein